MRAAGLIAALALIAAPSAWATERAAQAPAVAKKKAKPAAKPADAADGEDPTTETRHKVRAGETLVVPKLDRLARSVPDARAIADELEKRGVSLALGKQVYDPNDPMGRMFFNILATFAEFESDLSRLRTREGMKIARDKGKLRGKPPKLSDLQQRELLKMHATGEYSISDLGKLFKVSRPTVYRTIRRNSTD